MGHFRIEIDAVGGHGCDRNAQNNEFVQGCGLPNCPDCLARAFVRDLKKRGFFNNYPASAVLTHWPGTDGEVRDNLLSGRRKGQF